MNADWSHAIRMFDHRTEAYAAAYRERSTIVGIILVFVARYGPTLFFVEMFLLCLSSTGRTSTLQHAALSIAVAVFAAVSTKLIIDPMAQRIARVRPFVRYQYEPLLAKDATDPSFPSNHAGGALALATVLSYQFPGVSAITLGLALMVLLSRIYAGLHYVSDLIAGALVGTTVAVFYLWLIR